MSYALPVAIFIGLWLALLSYVVIRLLKREKEGFDPRVLGLMRSIGELQIELADLRDLYERLMTSHKRLRSSAGMAKLRGIKEKSDQDDLKHASEAEILNRLKLSRGKS